MEKPKQFNQDDLYVPDFVGDRAFTFTYKFIMVGVILFSLVFLFLFMSSGQFLETLKDLSVLLLYAAVIIGIPYFVLKWQREKKQAALKTALKHGRIIQVTVDPLNIGEPTEVRGKNMDTDFGNLHPAGGESFYDVKADFNGQRVVLPHIPSAQTKLFIYGNKYDALYSDEYPKIAFLIKESQGAVMT
jgi:hypothetical protein